VTGMKLLRNSLTSLAILVATMLLCVLVIAWTGILPSTGELAGMTLLCLASAIGYFAWSSTRKR
jgi:hypothetical protein